MRERPIIFSAAMIRALLAGRKTQTRRVMKYTPARIAHEDETTAVIHRDGSELRWWYRFDREATARIFEAFNSGMRVTRHRWRQVADTDRRHMGDWHRWTIDEVVNGLCPYGVPGDRLWVREAWATRLDRDDVKPSDLDPARDAPMFWANPDTMNTGCGDAAGRVRSPIHMPRWASRLTLEITGVRVERLQEITEENAIAEGVEPLGPPRKIWTGIRANAGYAREVVTHREAFMHGWNEIHGAGAWDLNPWVWVLTFKRIAP